MNIKKLKSFGKNLKLRFVDDEISALSSQLAYSFLLSFFPFLIFLLTLVGLSSIKSEYVLSSLKDFLPLDVYKLVYKTVEEVLNTKNLKLLSFGFLITFFSAASGFNAVIRGLNKAYGEEERRSFIKVQLVSIISTVVLALVILLSMVLLVFGEINERLIANYFNLTWLFNEVWEIIRYMIMALVMIISFGALYHFTPCRKLTIRDVITGALFSTAGWLIISIGFAYYVNNFGGYSIIYGGIGAVIALMTWMFLSSAIILLGGEINAVLLFEREGKKKEKGRRY